MRSVLWRLEAGEPGSPDRLVEAARVARSFSLEAAERLAVAAMEAGGGVSATVLRAELLTHLHRHREAEELLSGLPPGEARGRRPRRGRLLAGRSARG